MTGLALGLMLGAGLFLVWSSFWVPPAERRVTRNRLRDRLADEIVQSGIPGLGVGTLIAFALGTFAIVFVIFQLVVGAAPLALCFALMAGWSPIVFVRVRARRRRARLRELWPDAIDNVASGVRAGLALPEALGQLSVRGPEGLSDPVGDRLIESLRMAREVGGSDLGRLLRTLSIFLREDARTRAELETRQSWTVNAARLAVAAPWLVLLILSGRRESVAAYSSLTGVGVLAGGAAVSAIAYWAMLRIARLPEEGRVLR